MTIRSLAASAVVAAALLTSPDDASADPNPTIAWLMEDQLTMWDWGIIRLEQRAQAAADEIAGDSPLRFRSRASHSFVENKLFISMESLNYPGPYTAERCNDIRRQALRHIIADPSRDNYHVWPAGVIDALFSHPGGFYRKDRPDDIGQQIAAVTYLTISLNNFSETGQLDGIECSGTVYEVDAIATTTP